MTYCYEAYCKIPEINSRGSTGGVASGLAYYMLKSGYVSGVLVCRKYETFIATDLTQLLESCGSIYEDFMYYIPIHNCNLYAQIGKPCNITEQFKFSISLFCSSIFLRQNTHITKQYLRDLSVSSRYLKKLVYMPLRCRICKDHVGSNADICVGDSQINPKINHVIVQSEQGKQIWDESIKDNIISAKLINFKHIQNRQLYLWKGGVIKWIIKKLQKSF